MATHTLFDGNVQIYRRTDSGPWQVAARVDGERYRKTTGESSLERAKDIAEEWYLGLRGKYRAERTRAAAVAAAPPKERTFGDAAAAFMQEARILAATVRSPKYIQMMEMRMKAHVLPFFKDKPISAVNRGLMQSYRVSRAEATIAKTTVKGKAGAPDIPGKPPARSTMLQEIVIVRQVLKHAEGQGWIAFVPNLSTAYMTQGKKGRRAWFSQAEYDQLREATAKRITEGTRRGWKPRYEELHDFVQIMANTGLRPDEAWRLEFRDVAVEDDYATGQTILVIDVRGKTGVGFCKSLPEAVAPYLALRQRREAELAAADVTAEDIGKVLAKARVFIHPTRDLLNAILAEEDLKLDRDGQRRTAYSLRHTYISIRLMEGANIHVVANNCRTSVQMIEEHYAAHIRNRIDAAALNVTRPKPVGLKPPLEAVG